MVVERVVARAWLHDPDEELARAEQETREGDESWARWIDELRRGDAVVAGLRVTAHVRLPDGSTRTVEAENHHVWLEVVGHPPMLEAQIEEVSSKDFKVLSQQLRELGCRITAEDLGEMYVHVRLGDDLLAAMHASQDGASSRAAAQPGLGTETGDDARL